MPFRRVQYRASHSPVKHIFFISDSALASFPEKYKVVDSTSYAAPGAVEYATSPVVKKTAVVAPVTGVREEGESHG